MPSNRLTACSVVFFLGFSGIALAQSPAETGTGGDVTATARARNTTAVGQTKPPGAAAGGEVDRNADRLQLSEGRRVREPDATETRIVPVQLLPALAVSLARTSQVQDGRADFWNFYLKSAIFFKFQYSRP